MGIIAEMHEPRTTETMLNTLIAQRTLQAMKVWRACVKRGHSAHDRWVIYTAHEDIARWSKQRESLARRAK